MHQSHCANLPLGGGRVELRTTTLLAPSPMGEFFVADEITPWGWHGVAWGGMGKGSRIALCLILPLTHHPSPHSNMGLNWSGLMSVCNRYYNLHGS